MELAVHGSLGPHGGGERARMLESPTSSHQFGCSLVFSVPFGRAGVGGVLTLRTCVLSCSLHCPWFPPRPALSGRAKQIHLPRVCHWDPLGHHFGPQIPPWSPGDSIPVFPRPHECALLGTVSCGWHTDGEECGPWSQAAGEGILVLLRDLGQVRNGCSLGLPFCKMGTGKIFPANFWCE